MEEDEDAVPLAFAVVVPEALRHPGSRERSRVPLWRRVLYGADEDDDAVEEEEEEAGARAGAAAASAAGASAAACLVVIRPMAPASNWLTTETSPHAVRQTCSRSRNRFLQGGLLDPGGHLRTLKIHISREWLPSQLFLNPFQHI